MIKKAISSLLILTLVSSNSAMAISKDQQEADLATPIELVEYVRDDSIPVSYALCENPCSYEKLVNITAEENITQVLPGDVLCYDKELLWDCNIPDMVEAGELTKYQDTIIISYVSAENYVTATYYQNEDYEIYAKPLEISDEETVIRVRESKGGVIDNYSLRRKATAVRNSAAVAASAKNVALHPTCFGCLNTSQTGINEVNGQMLCQQLNQYVYVRCSLVETNFQRKTVSSRTIYAANTAVTVIATEFVTQTGCILSVLSLAGVAVSAAQRIQEMIALEKNPVYTATYGRCGDVRDVTTFNGQYCRVIDATEIATYTYGHVVGTSYNGFVRTVYNTTAQEVREDALYNYNMCIATHGANTLYYPI